MRRVHSLVVVLFLGVLAGCAQPAPSDAPKPGPPWLSAYDRQHPLGGRIWEVARARFVAPETLAAGLKTAPFVLLGEKHDNPDHHRIQAWILRALIDRGRRPAVAFEMFDTDQAERLEKFLAGHDRDAAGLARAVGWFRERWPGWPMYAPIAQVALDAGLPIVAANLSRRMIRRIAKQGVAALGAKRVRALELERPMPAALRARMRTEIVASHCDQLPQAMIEPLVTVMKARDAAMAWAMIEGARKAGSNGAVLIAGGGHARTDHGVPWHLRRLAPGRAVVAVALVEVAADKTMPTAYAERFGAERIPFDYVWFTPRVDEGDPCVKFADQFRRFHNRPPK